MALFVYVNTGGDQDLRERDLVGADAAGFLIDMSCVLADRCSSSTPAAARDALQQLVRRVRQGDTVVVARLSYLGNGIADVVATLKALRLKRIRCVCLELGNADLCATGDGTPLRVLQSVQGMEAEINRARGREASALAKRNGLPQGRPASLSAEQRERGVARTVGGKNRHAGGTAFRYLAANGIAYPRPHHARAADLSAQGVHRYINSLARASSSTSTTYSPLARFVALMPM